MTLSREKLAADIHRPLYHFLPPSNWMNDPNGVIQWKGQYHLFYQHNPSGPLWGNMSWGHAVSADLIHWTHLPLALVPTPGGPDETGCFSGCAVVNDGLPTIIYTATAGERNEIQTQCLATSEDDLLTWRKYPDNPVLGLVPEAAGQTSDFRDPFVWKEGDTWYMVLASRIQDVGGVIFLYRSPNLIDWEYLHPLLVGDIKRNGIVWECPNFFKLGDQWVLIVSAYTGSPTGTVFYFVGSYENEHFTPTSEGVVDYGVLYAPLSFVDDQNRRLLYGWLRESRSSEKQSSAGWSGVQSIPRVLTLDEQNRLNMVPVPELVNIRGQCHHFDAMSVAQETALNVTGLSLEIIAEFVPDAEGNCGISLVCSPDGQERTDIVFEAARQHIVVRNGSRQVGDEQVSNFLEAQHILDTNEALKLHILLDGSVIEIVANNRTSLTSRIYPRDSQSNQVRLLNTNAHLHSLDIWEMTPIW